MKKNTAELPSALPPALSYAEAASMTRAEAVTRFQVEASAGQRAFSAMGKLFRVIEASLTKKDKGIFPLLQKSGIPKGSVSNASYAAKVFDLVDKKLLTEAEYDRLSHADCFNIVRVQSSRSAKQLTAEEVVAVVKAAKEPDEELTSLYETGLTLDEVKAKQAAADKVKADAEAAAATKATEEAAEIEAIKAENEALKAANAEPAATDTPTEKEKAPTTEETTEALEGVTLQGVLDALNAVELSFTELNEDDQAVVRVRVAELVTAITPTNPDKVSKGKKAVAA